MDKKVYIVRYKTYDSKWLFTAAFRLKKDALDFAIGKFNNQTIPMSAGALNLVEYKVMQGKKTIWKSLTSS